MVPNPDIDADGFTLDDARFQVIVTENEGEVIHVCQFRASAVGRWVSDRPSPGDGA